MDNEKDADIKLIVRGEDWGVQINVCAYPIFCLTCNNYFPALYRSKGSRYGYLGAVYCDCGEKIHLSDSDNIVDYVKCFTSRNNASIDKSIIIDFKEEFKLGSKDFEQLKEKFHYDIFEKHPNEEIYLSSLVKEIEKENNIKAIPIESIIPLPFVVKEWIGLLNIANKNV